MLLKKLWRDLLKNKVQFISIFLMSFLGLYIFVGIDSECTGGTETMYQYYSEQNLADLWVQGKAFSANDLKHIQNIPEVSLAERRLNVEAKSKSFEDEPNFFLNFLETNNISKIKIVKGEEYSEGESGIWIDNTFAEKRNLQIGDTINIDVDGCTISEVIKGTIFHPEYVYFVEDAAAMMPDYGAYCYAFLSVDEYPGDIFFNQVIIDSSEINNEDEVSEAEKRSETELAEKLKALMDLDTLVVTGKKVNSSYATFNSEMQQHRSMAVAYPAVFMLISVLGIITTMTRLTANQRIQIGTLKALGFSRRDITLHYVSYGFFLSLTGSVLGALVGFFTLPDFILSMFVGTYQMPGLHKGFSRGSFICIVVMVAVSTAITYYAVRKEGVQPPAETLKPAPPKLSKKTWLEGTDFWKKLDFSTQWNLRDIMRNKIRTIMGMVGVLGSAMLIFSAFGCLDSVNALMTLAYGRINTASYGIVLAEDASYEDAYEYARKYDGQMLEERAIELESDGRKKTGTIRVLDKGNYMHFLDESLNNITFDKNTIGISYKMADILGVTKGDYVKWHIIGDDDYYRFRVGQIYRDPSAQGITMYRPLYEELDRKFSPTQILTNHRPPDILSDEESVTGVQDMNEAMGSMEAMMEMMYTMIGILIFAAIVLGVVVLYNLGVLSMVEKSREMATLKVLGFDSRKIRAILSQQNIWITFCGIIMGFPFGFAILGMMFKDMPDAMDFSIVVNPPSYAYAIMGTFLLSMTVNRVLSKKIETIDMVDALKGQE